MRTRPHPLALQTSAPELFVLEMNELNHEVLRRMMDRGALPHFARLMDSHVCLNTDAQAPYASLEPWIQWVTVHTGLRPEQHGLSNLTQRPDQPLRQIWEVLDEAGIACGAVCPMNATRGRLQHGFFIPDPWIDNAETFPETLRTVHRFLAINVHRHHHRLQGGLSALRFAWQSLALGVSIRTLLRTGVGFLRSRIQPRHKWRLAALLDGYLLELCLVLRRRHGTRFNQVFLNAMAHYQHHYWTEHEPEHWRTRAPTLFAHGNVLSAQNLMPGDDPLSWGLQHYDRLLGQVMAALPIESIMIVTALSQVPYDGTVGPKGFCLYRPFDHAQFFAALGVRAAKVSPLMSRDCTLHFVSRAERDEAVACLRTVKVREQALLHCEAQGDLDLFCKIDYAGPAGPEERIVGPLLDPAGLAFSEHLQLITIKTGHHDPHGWVLVHRSVLPPDEVRRDRAAATWSLERVHNLQLDRMTAPIMAR